MLRVGADCGPPVPASLAFFVRAFFGDDLCLTLSFFEFYFAYDAECGKVFEAELLNRLGIITTTADSNTRFLIAADDFVATKGFKGLEDLVAKEHKHMPFWVL